MLFCQCHPFVLASPSSCQENIKPRIRNSDLKTEQPGTCLYLQFMPFPSPAKEKLNATKPFSAQVTMMQEGCHIILLCVLYMDKIYHLSLRCEDHPYSMDFEIKIHLPRCQYHSISHQCHGRH